MTSKPATRAKYSEFMKLSPEERLTHSEYFLKKYSGHLPIVLFSRDAKQPELPNCKFMIDKKKQLFAELNALKGHILKNRTLSESESIFFGYNRKMLNGNVKVEDFYKKEFKDTQKDGWMHIEYGKQDIY